MPKPPGTRASSRSPSSAAKPRATARDVVRAYVTPRPAEVVVPESEAGSAAARSPYISAPADPQQLKKLSTQLQKHGFEIVSASPVAVAIEAPPATFEEVFGTAVEPTAAARAARGLKYAAPRSGNRFSRPPQIPTDLADLVQEISFPAAAAVHKTI